MHNIIQELKSLLEKQMGRQNLIKTLKDMNLAPNQLKRW
jgi:hypothetical protein